MQEQPLAGTHREQAEGPFAESASRHEGHKKPQMFRLDVAPDDVALMVRYRHELSEDTQVHVWSSVESIGSASTPAGYVVDSVSVLDTHWDGQSPGGMHRVVCLLARKPNERSAVRYLVVIDHGDAIAVPAADMDVRRLNDFALVYAPGEILSRA